MHVIRTGRDGTTPRDGKVSVLGNRLVMIGGTTFSPTCGIMGSQEIVNIHGSTDSVEFGDT